VGTERVDIDVKKLTNEGALIANADIERDEDGLITGMTDNGNLNINADTIVYKDMKDTDTAENYSYGINVSGFSGAIQIPQGGTTQLNGSTSGHIKEGITRATMGQGTIVADNTVIVTSEADKEDVNRDIADRQDLTKNEVTGGLDFNMTIDNKMLTDPGGYLLETGGNVLGLPLNTFAVVHNVKNAGIDAVTVLVDQASSNEDRSVVEDLQGKTMTRQVALTTKKLEKQIEEKINQKAITQAAQEISDAAVKAHGFLGEGPEVLFYNGDELKEKDLLAKDPDGKTIDKSKAKALYVNGKVYINAAKWDGSAEQLATTITHEVRGHYVDDVTNRKHTEVSADRGEEDVSAALRDKGLNGKGNILKSKVWVKGQAAGGAYGKLNQLVAGEKVVEADWMEDAELSEIPRAKFNKANLKAYGEGWDQSLDVLSLTTTSVVLIPGPHQAIVAPLASIVNSAAYGKDFIKMLLGKEDKGNFAVKTAFFAAPSVLKLSKVKLLPPKAVDLLQSKSGVSAWNLMGVSAIPGYNKVKNKIKKYRQNQQEH